MTKILHEMSISLAQKDHVLKKITMSELSVPFNPQPSNDTGTMNTKFS